MLRRRQINADPGGSGLRAAVAAAGRSLRSVAWAIEERVWPGGEFLRRLAEVARWPFERAAWIVERRLVWPLQGRIAGRTPSGRVAGAGALAAAGVAALALIATSLPGGGGEKLEVATPTRVAIAPAPAPPAAAEPTGPVLRGAAPSFEVEGADEVAAADENPAVAEPAADDLTATTGETATTSAKGKPVPAGPEAMKVARRFADAFVFYEVGEREERAREIFSDTATPQLATALAQRPPRQPASVEVPQARVLNLVPGPRQGKTYTVSASLLRIGTTSELRLEMRKKNGTWVITDVRG